LAKYEESIFTVSGYQIFIGNASVTRHIFYTKDLNIQLDIERKGTGFHTHLRTVL